jgi:diguanylate cyclase (GGDEF)-like protein
MACPYDGGTVVIAEKTYNATILIVDDHPTNLQVLLDFLQDSGYRTLIAQDGEGAVKQAAFAQPDLILLDVMMPGIDGFETCRRLKSSEETQEIPVIFMTALAETVDKVRGFDAGGVDYITKPFDQVELLARVKAHLDLRRYQKALQRSNEQLTKANANLLEAQRKLEVAAKTDPLTQLSNRRDMIEKLNYERVRHKRSQQPFSLILSDIDDFKRINDSYGHDCGDFVLMRVADIMRSMLREQDQLARWGGEEFLLMLPETDLHDAGLVAEKIRKTIGDHAFLYQDINLSVSLTFGVSVFDDYEKSLDQCIKEADLALYRGKEQGKNQIVIFDEAELSEEHSI